MGAVLELAGGSRRIERGRSYWRCPVLLGLPLGLVVGLVFMVAAVGRIAAESQEGTGRLCDLESA